MAVDSITYLVTVVLPEYQLHIVACNQNKIAISTMTVSNSISVIRLCVLNDVRDGD